MRGAVDHVGVNAAAALKGSFLFWCSHVLDCLLESLDLMSQP